MNAIVAPAHWRTVAFISDIHLSSDEQETAASWMDYMASSKADAIFILGDWFEVWVGDDDDSEFVTTCAQTVRTVVESGVEVFVMHGNRDFLMGVDFAKRCGFSLLTDPCTLRFDGQTYLLSHGDALCTDDTDYMVFRKTVRSDNWQSAFLAKPLAERKAIAAQLRAQSKAKQSDQTIYADVNEALATQWLMDSNCQTMIHGHTHKPCNHDLGNGLKRVVLSDWDTTANPKRAQVLELTTKGLDRRNI